MEQLKYIDHKSMTWYGLTYYPSGLSPAQGDIIKCTETEKKSLLREKNGKNPKFEEIKKSRKPKDDEEEFKSPLIPSEE